MVTARLKRERERQLDGVFSDQRFATGFKDWAQARLTAREIAMLQLMNDITDRPGWNIDVLHNPAVVAQWKNEALKLPLISSAAWDWCLAELQDKSRLLDDLGMIHILDSASRMCKSDRLISSPLLDQLACEVEKLASKQEDLVNPNLHSLCPKTRILPSPELVPFPNSVDVSGKGTTVRRPPPRNNRRRRGGFGGTNRRESSTLLQWLPCEVKFKSKYNIVIESYINNLHPIRHSRLYGVIEECISASVRAWNEVLIVPYKGRCPERIRTFGVEWTPKFPEWCHYQDFRPYSAIPEVHDRAHYDMADVYINQPDNPLAPPPTKRYPMVDSNWKQEYGLSRAVSLKYDRIKYWLHPEPGVAFTYNEWKIGKNNGAVVAGRSPTGEGPLPPKPDHEFYNISLQDQFQNEGLQIVVEIGSIELTPEHPTSPPTPWSLSGLPNDKIVSTTLLFFSSTNISPSASCPISFRVEADMNPTEFHFGTSPTINSSPFHPFAPLASIFSINPHMDLGDDGNYSGGGPALQFLGTVQTPDGRLVAFPNAVQHRFGACALLDPTKKGRRRFLRLHLVDPYTRVTSAERVPPQRRDWWVEEGMGRIDWGAREMPEELVGMVGGFVDSEEGRGGEGGGGEHDGDGDNGMWPMGREEAEELKRELERLQAECYAGLEEGAERYRFGSWAQVGRGWTYN